LIRVISISAVAEGPEINVVGSVAVARKMAIASGTVATILPASTRQRW
jgi:hypothetical protein